MHKYLAIAISASIEAGIEILKIYHTDFQIEYKADESPLTTADKKANEVIMSYLSKTGIPVLSEEGRSIPYKERKNWNELWIVDPLDGTKEFIKKNDEFTVNIALVVDGIPVIGVIYIPVLDELYFGDLSMGAYKLESASLRFDLQDVLCNTVKLPVSEPKSYYGVVASRSHLSVETVNFIDEIKKTHEMIRVISIGSSIKLCLIAEGIADIYPRFAPTSEWDIAAGHAIVKASGGKVLQAVNSNKELVYNKEDLLNPWFIARR